MLTLDEEIMMGKYQRELNKKVEELMETIDFSDNSPEALLNLKYSETAESLREFNYDKLIFEILKESKDYEMISALKEKIRESMKKIDTTDMSVIKEGYRELTEMKLIIENTLDKAMKNGGADLKKYQEKTGYSDKRYEEKAAAKEKSEFFKNAYFHGGEFLKKYQKKYNVSDEDYENEAEKFSNRK